MSPSRSGSAQAALLHLAQGAVRELRLEQEGNQAMTRHRVVRGIIALSVLALPTAAFPSGVAAAGPNGTVAAAAGPGGAVAAAAPSGCYSINWNFPYKIIKPGYGQPVEGTGVAKQFVQFCMSGGEWNPKPGAGNMTESLTQSPTMFNGGWTEVKQPYDILFSGYDRSMKTTWAMIKTVYAAQCTFHMTTEVWIDNDSTMTTRQWGNFGVTTGGIPGSCNGWQIQQDGSPWAS